MGRIGSPRLFKKIQELESFTGAKFEVLNRKKKSVIILLRLKLQLNESKLWTGSSFFFLSNFVNSFWWYGLSYYLFLIEIRQPGLNIWNTAGPWWLAEATAAVNHWLKKKGGNNCNSTEKTRTQRHVKPISKPHPLEHSSHSFCPPAQQFTQGGFLHLAAGLLFLPTKAIFYQL